MKFKYIFWPIFWFKEENHWAIKIFVGFYMPVILLMWWFYWMWTKQNRRREQ